MKSLLILAVICLTSTLAITCYTGTSSTGVVSYDCDVGGNYTYDLCIKYDFECTEGDLACTSQQITDQYTLTAYICGTQTLCSEMQDSPSVYKNLVCCETDECNGATGLAASFVGIVALIAMLL